MAGTWQSLNQQPQFAADTMLLLTDGRVMCHEADSSRWHVATQGVRLREMIYAESLAAEFLRLLKTE
jgi:hypothetical protein